jgi:hypothetical protein
LSTKNFNLPTIEELAIAQYNDMLMYQRQLDELNASNDQSVYGLFRHEELERKVRESQFMLSKYKQEIREEKFKRLGL